ncbi:MAG: precorrin-6y C5,15-methyltransferase (decarboxylating) subunit CbiE [Bacteroidaceae bacterium]|nr:precorrin-6y C5,15-methyltransferase (decarboxylating) subunit CbiE [Bacteroidaceae bacterium]
MKKVFIVIGIDDNRQQRFAPEVVDAIRTHRVFSGGRRHYDAVKELLPVEHEWIPITVPIPAVFKTYESIHEEIVVFASGDPLFFGFANTIQREMPDAQMVLYPSFNSLQMLAHRVLLPYHDMKTVSLTGRPWHELDAALIRGERKIGVLTDGVHSPRTIAERLLHFGFSDYRMLVGEHLGNSEQERVTQLSLEEAKAREFERPNCVILHRAPSQPPRGEESEKREVKSEKCHPDEIASHSSLDASHSTLHVNKGHGPGIPDHLFDGLAGRPKMITKAAIRVLTLAALDLQHRTCLWDIGFCTGSVSIEARLLFPHLHVVAFEIRPECEMLMKNNAVRFHAPGIQAFIADFLEADVDALRDEEEHALCQPDAVFVGGHGGRLQDVIVKAFNSLQKGGVMVYNCVDPASVTDDRIRSDSEDVFCKTASQLGMEVLKPISVTVDDYHPIKILKALK